MSEYLSLVEDNLEFMQQKPFRILVTATMSAGKSTFVNALVGRKITMSQNLACTSKIHTIISKPYEDGFVCRDDGDLILNVNGSDLLKNNPTNLTNHLATAIYFDGDLAGMRLATFYERRRFSHRFRQGELRGRKCFIRRKQN